MTAGAGIARRLARLEAEAEVRGVLGRYMQLCDALDADTPMDELAALFTSDAVWTGVGPRYAAAFGGHEGRAAIVAMFDAYRGPEPHFAMNAHFLSGETLIHAGDAIVGRWSMLQTATYADGRSDLRCARLTVTFARDGDRWRIARFETRNVFSRAVAHWDDARAVPAPARLPTGD